MPVPTSTSVCQWVVVGSSLRSDMFIFFFSLCSNVISAEFGGVRGVTQSLFFCHEFLEFSRIVFYCVFSLSFSALRSFIQPLQGCGFSWIRFLLLKLTPSGSGY